MSSAEVDCDWSAFVGRWAGTDSLQPFEHYVEIDLFRRDADLYLQRHDRHAASPEAKLLWLSPTQFHLSIAHWILPGTVRLQGNFRPDGVLPLDFDGEGMTGLQNYQVELRKNDSSLARFQNPRLDPLYKYHRPVTDDDYYESRDAAQEGLSVQAVEAAISKIIAISAPAITDPHIDGILILRNGHLVVEEYFWGMTKTTEHMISSCTKSITAILVGIAIDHGYMTLDDIVSEAFESDSEWSSNEPIRLRHVLGMTSGTAFDSPDSNNADSQGLLQTSNIAEYMLATPRTTPKPGEIYHYNNGLPTMLCPLLERKTGLSVRAFAEQYLFQPLGITQYQWTEMREVSPDHKPSVLTAGGLYMTLRDMAKIGQMVLDNGIYQKKHILSSWYSKAMTSQQTVKGQYPYGYYWHIINRDQPHSQRFDGFAAIGQGGQVIIVLPAEKLVLVAVSSSWQDNRGDDGRAVFNISNMMLDGLSNTI